MTGAFFVEQDTAARTATLRLARPEDGNRRRSPISRRLALRSTNSAAAAM